MDVAGGAGVVALGIIGYVIYKRKGKQKKMNTYESILIEEVTRKYLNKPSKQRITRKNHRNWKICTKWWQQSK